LREVIIMSNLVNVLYPLPDFRRTPLSTVRWWESRRLTFNKAVGSAGLVTLAGMSFLFALPPYSSPMPLTFMLFGVAVYGIAANVCYTLGWMIELLARAAWGRSAPDMGPLVFRQGVIFSVGLTLMPLLLAAMHWMARCVAWLAT
jgi:hypothetical protein